MAFRNSQHDNFHDVSLEEEAYLSDDNLVYLKNAVSGLVGLDILSQSHIMGRKNAGNKLKIACIFFAF